MQNLAYPQKNHNVHINKYRREDVLAGSLCRILKVKLGKGTRASNAPVNLLMHLHFQPSRSSGSFTSVAM